MKRTARPFVVEVKKKRGSPAKRRSIWGDLDLSTVTADTSSDSEGIDEPAGHGGDLKPVVAFDREGDMDPAVTTMAPDGDTPASLDATDAAQHSADVEPEYLSRDPMRSPQERIRRRGEQTLPRGQRWKRRLPKALRR